MLVAMDENRPLFSNACSDSVRAFYLFRPDTPDPDTPILELVRLGFISAVMDGYSIGIA
jgi:hypothetical protein